MKISFFGFYEENLTDDQVSSFDGSGSLSSEQIDKEIKIINIRSDYMAALVIEKNSKKRENKK